MAFPKWLSTLANLAPLVLATIPSFPKALIPAVVAGMAAAESLGTAGSDKKASVLALATSVAEGLNVVKPGSVDPATLSATVGNAVDTVVGVVNLVHKS